MVKVKAPINQKSTSRDKLLMVTSRIVTREVEIIDPIAERLMREQYRYFNAGEATIMDINTELNNKFESITSTVVVVKE